MPASRNSGLFLRELGARSSNKPKLGHRKQFRSVGIPKQRVEPKELVSGTFYGKMAKPAAQEVLLTSCALNQTAAFDLVKPTTTVLPFQMCILARKQHLSPVPHKKQSPSPVASTDRFWPPSLPLSCGDLLLPNQDPSNSHSNSRDSWSWNGTELVSLRQNGKLVHSSRWKKLLRGPPILRSTCTS